MKNKTNTYWKITILTIFFVQIILFMVLFINKVEYHSDEIWSYGISNNHGNPAIYKLNGHNINFKEWISGKLMHDYVTVQPDEKFDYNNVYNNTIIDNSQPLYMFMLHTICSFFPDKFSFWFLVPIQLFSIVMGLYFFYKILSEVELPRTLIVGLMCILIFSVGGINNAMFMRQYALYTAFSTGLLFYHIKIYKRNEIKLSDSFTLSLLIVVGTLTHVFFWIYAFILGVIWFFMYLTKKEWKKILKYSISMFSGVIISILYFPYLFKKTEIYLDSFEPIYDFKQQWRILRSTLIANIMGWSPSIYESHILLYITLCLLFSVIVLSPLFFLFRNEKWFIAFRKKVYNKICYIKQILKNYFIKYGVALLAVIIECIVNISVLAKLVDCYYMKDTVFRYLTGIFPCAVLVFGFILALLYDLFDWKIIIKNTIPILVCLLAVIFSYVIYTPSYYSKNTRKGTTISDIHNSNIIVILDDDWKLTYLTPYIDIDSYLYATTYYTYEEEMNDISEINNDKPTYLLLDTASSWIISDFSKVKKDYFKEGNVSLDEYLKAIEQFKKQRMEKLKQNFLNTDIGDEYTEIGSEDMINFGYKLIKIKD